MKSNESNNKQQESVQPTTSAVGAQPYVDACVYIYIYIYVLYIYVYTQMLINILYIYR